MTYSNNSGLTCYIAGPMSGYKDFNYPAFFEAEKQVAALGYTPLNPAWADGPSYTWEQNMRRGLRLLLTADLLVLLPGWEYSKGARLESHTAVELGLPVYTLDRLPPAELLSA